jgi:hypothetical protein
MRSHAAKSLLHYPTANYDKIGVTLLGGSAHHTRHVPCFHHCFAVRAGFVLQFRELLMGCIDQEGTE